MGIRDKTQLPSKLYLVLLILPDCKIAASMGVPREHTRFGWSGHSNQSNMVSIFGEIEGCTEYLWNSKIQYTMKEICMPSSLPI